jgi:Tfp pilus assembly protein FimT
MKTSSPPLPGWPFLDKACDRDCKTPHSLRAFTLVELILVMTLLVIMVSLSAPLMANFFRGRALDSEVRRMLALTHGGQSRAVYEGVPMLLWVDVTKGSYGLEAEPGWEDHDAKAEEFALDPALKLEVINAPQPSAASTSASRNAASALPQARPKGRDLPEIRFLPDGSIDETSPAALKVSDRDGVRFLAQSRNHLNYEVRNDFNQ